MIRSLCLTCYAAGASRTGHSHNLSFYASNSDSILPDSQLPQQKWIVRRNSSKRLWYEHRQTGYKTYMQPMTAICKLPAGWQLKKDPEGKIYYENALTGQLSRTAPAGLPAGWREAKDPDGKSFFIHDGLQLASWYRPGEQPPVRRPDGGGQTTTPIPAGPISTALIRSSGSGPVARPAQIAAKANLVTIGPRRSAPTAGAAPPSTSQVTIQTAAEATINLIDPSEGGIVRNTKIAAHIAGKGVRSTVKAMKHNKRLQNFAKGTGIAVANRQVKKAWRKAAIEVSARERQEVTIRQGGSQGQELIVEEVDEGYDGEYVVEYDDGTVECYGADCQEEPPQRTWQEQQAWELAAAHEAALRAEQERRAEEEWYQGKQAAKAALQLSSNFQNEVPPDLPPRRSQGQEYPPLKPPRPHVETGLGGPSKLRRAVEYRNTDGARPSQLVSSGQRVSGQRIIGQQRNRNTPQQYQTRQQRYQSTNQQAHRSSITVSNSNTGLQENAYMSTQASQGLYTYQGQEIYIDQSQDTFIDESQDTFINESQDTSVDQNLTTDQIISVEQNTDIFEDQSNNYNMDDQQDFVYDQELEIEGEGADFVGAMDAGGDMGDYVDF